MKMPVPGFDRSVWIRPGTSDFHVYEQIFVTREYDFDFFSHGVVLRRAYEALVSAGKKLLIIDCGANIGLSAVWFKLNFPDAIVVAIEPNRENFDLLTLNAAGLDGVHPMLAAVWDKRATLGIANPDGEAWGFRVEETAAGAPDPIAAVTIPEILADHSDACPFIAKIDIEGGEASLFKGPCDWLDDMPVVVIELHDWLNPWTGMSQGFFRAILRRERDYVVRGDLVFCLLHDLAMGGVQETADAAAGERVPVSGSE